MDSLEESKEQLEMNSNQLDSEKYEVQRDFEDSDLVDFQVEEQMGSEQNIMKSGSQPVGVVDASKITDKQFYKEMQKIKDRGTNAVPPKKAASAYIIFCQKVSQVMRLMWLETSWNFEAQSNGQSYWSGQRDGSMLGRNEQRSASSL